MRPSSSTWSGAVGTWRTTWAGRAGPDTKTCPTTPARKSTAGVTGHLPGDGDRLGIGPEAGPSSWVSWPGRAGLCGAGAWPWWGLAGAGADGPRADVEGLGWWGIACNMQCCYSNWI